MSRWTTAILAGCLFAGFDACAAVERICLVSTYTNKIWSPERRQRVAFVTGVELSRIAPNLKFDLHQDYALVLPERGLPTVVRVNAVNRATGHEFTAEDFQRTFQLVGEREGIQAVGEGIGLKWQIRAKTLNGWIDPQMQ